MSPELVACMTREGIDPLTVERHIASWSADQDGWTGGFLLRLRDHSYTYLTGQADLTGHMAFSAKRNFPKQPPLYQLGAAAPWCCT